MKKQLNIISFIILLATSIISPNISVASDSDTIQNIALIIDSNEFYHPSFTDSILRAFDSVNQTYNIDYEVFLLYNYTNVDSSPYQAIYYNNDTKTNHTELARNLIGTNKYDLIVLMGYELRREFLNFSEYPNTNFLFYDLSGELPKEGNDIPDNLLVISCRENEIGFIAGTLTTATITPLPHKIAMVGTKKSDPRSRKLLAGFQSAIFRNYSDVSFLISYIDDYANSTKAASIANDLKEKGYELVFAALQNNNSLGFSEGFSSGIVISVDSNRTQSVMKNNTKIIMHMFHEINQTGFTGGQTVTFGLQDEIFYPTTGWGDEETVNSVMDQIYKDIVLDGSLIPTDILYASNTPGFEFLFSLIILFALFLYNKHSSIKKRR